METFFSLALFVFVASITPGPNNLMLLSAGANFGFRKSLPHVFGINIGSGLMVLIVGVGLTELFDDYPMIFLVLKFASLSYLLFLAWRLVNSKTTENAQQNTLKPLTFLGSGWVSVDKSQGVGHGTYGCHCLCFG